MIASCKLFVETYLGDFAPDAAVRLPKAGSNWRAARKDCPGWRLSAEFTPSALSFVSGDPLNSAEVVNIVLVASGEIYCERGTPRLSGIELLADPWVVPVWMTELKDHHQISRWPAGAEDLRRLAIDFHTQVERAAPRPTRQPDAELSIPEARELSR